MSVFEGAEVRQRQRTSTGEIPPQDPVFTYCWHDWSIINKKKPHFISPAAKDRQILEQVPRVYTFLCARRKQGDAKEEEEVKGNIWCITSAPGLLTVGNH